MTTRLDDALSNPLPYCAYLVRLWREAPDTPWRASVQSVQSGEIVRFGSLPALFTFFEERTGDIQQTNASPTGHDASDEEL